MSTGAAGFDVLTERDQDKILRLAAPALLPLLRLRREQSISKLLGIYHSGGDLRSAAAELSVYEAQILDLQRKLAQGE